MGNRQVLLQTMTSVLIGGLLLAGLYLTSLHSYLLFHSLIELFTIIVTAGIFVIVWNARGYLNNNYWLFVGVAFLFVALLDVVHILVYKGMGVFVDPTGALSTQLWIAARSMQSVTLLIAPFFLGRHLRVYFQITIYALLTGLLLGSIFYWRIFPVTFVEGIGLTPFKVVSEYVISFFFLASVGLLLWKREEFDPGVLRLLTLSILLIVGSELIFTSYVSLYGDAPIIGHFLRLLAFYFLYKAIIETGLVNPYKILLRDLKLSEIHLRQDVADQNTRYLELTRVDEQLCQDVVDQDARYRELTSVDDQLRADAVMLQARNEELDSYAHTVAHNLKNPLSIIIAVADLINTVTTLTPSELKDCLLQVKSTAFEMDDIIDNLLLLSEVRNAEVPLGPVDMTRAVERVRGRLGHMIKERHARVTSPPTWPAAIGYSPWIEEVWANYLSNAIKYGGRPPRVELGATTQQGMIRFWTHDHGPGIPAEMQKHLFLPFTQLGKVHKTGHGLGLSIVLHIVKKLGGEVGLESRPGQGSLFYFTLPAVPANRKERRGANRARRKIQSGVAA